MSRMMIGGWAAAVLCGLGLASWAPGDDQPKVKVELRLAETKSAEGLTEATVAGTTTKVYLHKEAVITNDDIADAQATVDANKALAVEITFTKEGQKKIARATEDHKDKPLAILLDGKVISAPVIKSVITDKAMITGNFTKGEVEQLARTIKGK
ncbi:MAG TPA: hypothetical protein VKD72_22880 [Gemmataceae bacterium]|nr:hypothetical protein [Gemmataceae bacterium]